MRYCVIGSLNMDMSSRTSRFPAAGETIVGSSFSINPGGKGGNQAVALAKLGAKVEMIGAIGQDPLGQEYKSILQQLGIGINGLAISPKSTGTAAITVTDSGENNIIVIPGANSDVSPELIAQHENIIKQSDIILLQLEIPLKSTLKAAELAKKHNKLVILDPAPAQKLPEALLALCDIITPNQTEAEILTGIPCQNAEGIEKAGKSLLSKGIAQVIIKAGKHGAHIFADTTHSMVTGYKVKTVDTVAAGDTFNGGLAFALGKGFPIEKAVKFANATAALSTTKAGAQGGMPTLADVEHLQQMQA